MKILFAADVPRDPNSGAAGTEYQTIQALRKLGHEVDEIWAADLPHRIKHGNLHYLLELPKGYRDAIRERWLSKSYDVIHVNQGHSYLAALDHKRQERRGIFVVRSHGLDDHAENVLKSWRKRLGIRNRALLKYFPGRIIDIMLDRHMKLATRYAAGFIVSSSLDRQFLLERHGMPPERVACIPQAPPDFFRNRPVPEFAPSRLRRLLFVGGVVYWKGPHTVAAVVNELCRNHQDISFTWVCGKDVHGTALNMLSPGARARTRMIGLGRQEDLFSIYDDHGIFLYPPLFDGFGKVFIEAMSRGLCVIATPTGGMKDILQDEINGCLVPFHAPNLIIRRIEYLMDNISRAAEISTAAILTSKDYSWERVARETEKFYRSLLMIRDDVLV